MAIAASLWFDPILEQKVRDIWAEFAQLGVSRLLHDGPYRPHVTLAVWDVERLDPLITRLRGEITGTPAFPITLESVGSFQGVIYLRPADSPVLMDFRGRVCSLATRLGARPDPSYPSGEWIPHCTLAWELGGVQMARGRDALQKVDLPISGRAVAVGLIDTPAEAELERIELATMFSR